MGAGGRWWRASISLPKKSLFTWCRKAQQSTQGAAGAYIRQEWKGRQPGCIHMWEKRRATCSRTRPALETLGAVDATAAGKFSRLKGENFVLVVNWDDYGLFHTQPRDEFPTSDVKDRLPPAIVWRNHQPSYLPTWGFVLELSLLIQYIVSLQLPIFTVWPNQLLFSIIKM